MSSVDATRVAASTRGATARGLLVADWRRMRGTWLFPLTVLGPVGVTLLGVILFLLRGEYMLKPFLSGEKSGFMVVTEQLGMIHVFAIGLGAALLASMIVDLEHRSETWKAMFSLPVSRAGTYVVKFVWCAVLLAASSALMTLGYSSLVVWQRLGAVPWADLATLGALVWIASLPLLALQLFISTALHNQALPLTVGILAPIFGMSMSDLAPWTPWTLMTQALAYATGGLAAGAQTESLTGFGPAQVCTVAVGTTIVLVLCGTLALARREIR
ncbi:MAG: hypothetical protein CVT66_03210 [Actinobacteria bacterium HGW-Actinobacteria-6]|jgi:hypothetical protein|nr:MAG: hypothetical protein CVT66_03210 [Actinobacteria bacterium HGW-Actinobacteria-6]